MADTTFTPGPWEAFNRDTYQSIFAKGYERTICVVESYSKGFGPDRDERDANAHLIAAAPELYEALYRLVRDCEIAGLQEQAGFDCWIIMANKALAKARGEAA
ncbi:hypothetical protein [Brucella pseudogrignonensis]|uniref:Uncharacterized protein n=1 Tax=Brucella pseudogrignonensis TaxID=419475 RepID=A0ABU1M7I6_9HYPH|nr:hypothetical protein [Brucella pseudogrignonensis]MDR6432008.1 hypothetical protein [Brucella pseudogrignonensis]